MLTNEKGVTLLELLATLVIFGLFSTIILAVFFQSFKVNDAELMKNSLQQEANLILSTFHEVHRKSDSYTVIIVTGGDSLEIISDFEGTFLFDKPGVVYSLSFLTSGEIEILPKKTNFTMDLTLKSSDKPDIQTNIQTIFSRIGKEDGN